MHKNVKMTYEHKRKHLICMQTDDEACEPKTFNRNDILADK